MLNSNIIKVLSTLSNITNTVVLKHPTTIVNSPTGNILVHMNLNKFDTDKFEDFAVYNLSEFLSAFKLFSDNRTVTQDGNTISISDVSTSVNYITSNIALLSEYNKSVDAFTTTEAVPSVAEFTVTNEDVKKIKSAAGVFSDLTFLSITSQDGVVSLSLTAENKFNSRSNTFSIRKSDVKTTKEFEFKLPVSNFVSVPSSEYLVNVKYNSAKDAYRLMLNSTEIDDFKVLLAINK